jgi:hypothetical protein
MALAGCKASDRIFVGAAVGSFRPGASPAGYRSTSVVVGDVGSGRPVTDARVRVNGVVLTYDDALQDYEGDIQLTPGSTVELEVALLNGLGLQASTTQFTTYPTLTSPSSHVSWSQQCSNVLRWSSGGPTDGATYALGLVEAVDPNRRIWPPPPGDLETVAVDQQSYTFGPGSTPAAGNVSEYLWVLGIVRQVPIPSAATGSVLIVGGFDSVPVMIGYPLVVEEIGFTPPHATLPRGASETFTVQGWNCDSSVVELTPSVPLTSSDPAVLSFDNDRHVGTAVEVGDAALAATYGAITGTAPVSVRGTLVDVAPLPYLPPDWQGVVWSGSQFVAVSRGAAGVSTDGLHWNVVDGVLGQDWVQGVAWSGQLYAGVGATIVTSPDGVNWTSRVAYLPTALRAVTWSGQRFVAVGDLGEVMTSDDGSSWTVQDAGTSANLVGVTASAGQVVAVGESSSILTSSDGIRWTSRTPLPASPVVHLVGVVGAGSGFVALGGTNPFAHELDDQLAVVTSSDGAAWELRTFPDAGNFAAAGVAWTGTRLLAVDRLGVILSSEGATSWSQVLAPPWQVARTGDFPYFNAAAAAGETLVSVGDRGVILREP